MPFSAPLRVYGSAISYFTGKLEGYLRFKEIAYERVAMTPLVRARVGRRTGTTQMPAVELPDGRWITDTTPMIAWLETQQPEPAVIPPDPLQGFVSRLVEDYADEWMWRPALHYRWSHRGDAQLLSRRIVDEMVTIPLPGALKRAAIRLRQRSRSVRGDGITAATRPHVEGVYLRALEQLDAVLAETPFLLGARPTLADFGFFASMFRHFALDPTPGALMLERAPRVFAWVARVWSARAPTTQGALATGVPATWSPILREIGDAYLPYLGANAEAWKARAPRFDAVLQGVRYERLPTSRYRVWCLESLQRQLAALPDAPRAEARRLLDAHGCLEPLLRVAAPESGYDPDGAAPFVRGLPVFGA
jgi:glutathione S-transferase